MVRIILSVMSLGMLANAYAQCASESNIYTFTYNGKLYEVVKENKTWADAAACAVERGGYLAEINDAAENTALYSEITTNAGITSSNTVAPDGGGASYLWLGGSDRVSEGVWIWDGDNNGSGPQFWQGTTSGNPVGGLYNNWGNEPDNWNEQDGLGLAITNWPLGVASEWNDVDDGNTLYFVIEHDSSTGLNEGNNSLNIGPNPTMNSIKLNGDNIVEVFLYDSNGQAIIEPVQKIKEGYVIELSDYYAGIYFLKIQYADGKMTVQRIVRN